MWEWGIGVFREFKVWYQFLSNDYKGIFIYKLLEMSDKTQDHKKNCCISSITRVDTAYKTPLFRQPWNIPMLGQPIAWDFLTHGRESSKALMCPLCPIPGSLDAHVVDPANLFSEIN